MPEAIEDVKPADKVRRSTSRQRLQRYLIEKEDRERPFTGHECKVLRKQLGYTQLQMAQLVGCRIGAITIAEKKNTLFRPKFSYKLNQIRRYALKAQADLRDRFEMPDFSR
jgi:DNA-binding XRE family transcriptional regulator